MVILAYMAAIAVALFNGVSAILEKLGADTLPSKKTVGAKSLFGLVRNLPYVGGLALDGLATACTLFAVQALPLFVVEPIGASNVVITACIERFVYKRQLGKRVGFAITLLMIGLATLAFASAPEKAIHPHGTIYAIILIIPLALAGVGWVLTKVPRASAAALMAATSGIAFGGAAIAGRILEFDRPFWHLIYNPLVWAMVLNAAVGLWLFTVALSRMRATTANAAMIACETLFPAAFGIAFLGARPRDGLWALAIIGIVMAVVGAILVATADEEDVALHHVNGRT